VFLIEKPVNIGQLEHSKQNPGIRAFHGIKGSPAANSPQSANLHYSWHLFN
jgi:hypothetical protein